MTLSLPATSSCRSEGTKTLITRLICDTPILDLGLTQRPVPKSIHTPHDGRPEGRAVRARRVAGRGQDAPPQHPGVKVPSPHSATSAIGFAATLDVAMTTAP